MGWLIPTGVSAYVAKGTNDFQEGLPTTRGKHQRFVREGSAGRRMRTHAYGLLPAAALNVPAMALSRSKIKPKWVGRETGKMRALSVPTAALGTRIAANRNIKRGDVAVVNRQTQQQARRYSIFGNPQF